MAARLPSADEVVEGISLSPGAQKVWAELHDLALYVHGQREHQRLPDALTFHLPAVILASLTKYSERHLYRLLDELNGAGVIQSKGHSSAVGKLRRYDGTLFCVALRPGARPRLRWFDFQAVWRADFEADYYAEKGAWREVQEVMSEPFSFEENRARLRGLAQVWAAGSRRAKTTVEGGSDMRPAAGFADLALRLPGLLGMHPRQRHRAVSDWAASLAALLGEPHRLKQWCGAVYRALAAESEQRAALGRMAHELRRFGSELRQGEGHTMKNAGAVLASRLG